MNNTAFGNMFYLIVNTIAKFINMMKNIFLYEDVSLLSIIVGFTFIVISIFVMRSLLSLGGAFTGAMYSSSDVNTDTRPTFQGYTDWTGTFRN